LNANPTITSPSAGGNAVSTGGDARRLETGDVGFGSALGHIGYLAAFVVVGFVVALRIYRHKLEV